MTRTFTRALPLFAGAALALTALAAGTQAGAQTADPDAGFEPVRTANSDVKLVARYLKKEDWGKALAFADRALGERLPAGYEAAAHTNRCIALSQLGRHQDAVAACAKAVEIDAVEEEYATNLRIAEDRARQAAR